MKEEQVGEVLLSGAHGEVASTSHLLQGVHSGIETSKQEYISIDDVLKVQIHVGEVMDVEGIEWSDKLYKLTVDFGALGSRTVLSGIKKYTTREDLLGRQFPFVTNLAPRKIKDLTSEAMILAADGEVDGLSKLALFNPTVQLPNGTQIH